MGNLFGVRRKAPQITAQDRAILQLKQQRDKIKIYQKKTESDLAKNSELALNLFKNGMKDRAIIVLRRKKVMEDILARTDKQLETLESLVNDIEYTQIEVSVVEGLKVGTEALKQLNSLINIDDIQRMMDDNAEASEKQREVSAILSQTSERYADEDLLEELKKYQTADLSELPDVPEDQPILEEQEPSEKIERVPQDKAAEEPELESDSESVKTKKQVSKEPVLEMA